MTHINRLITGVLLALVCVATLFAQTETGQITGTVYDATGAAIPNATVTVRNVATGAERNTTASASGVYAVADLPAGDYAVAGSAQGFAKVSEQVTVAVGAKLGVDLHLQLGNTTTVVEVSGAATQINTETQTLSTEVNTTQLNELPTLTRNPYDLVAISGNASDGGAMDRGVGFAINGQRESDTNVLLDGTANNNAFATGPGQTVPLDSIQEFSILTNNFTAEYGAASGGVVNVVTKSGTNDFHGTLYEFNRVSDLSSNSFNNNAYSLPKSVFTRNQFGYSVGGPIKKNKLFFFDSNEWVRVRSSAFEEVVVPDQNLINASAANTQAFFNTYGKFSSGAQQVGTYTINQISSAQGASFCGSNAACNALNPNIPMFDLLAYSLPADSGGGSPQNTYYQVGRVDYNLSDKTQLYARYALQSDNFFSGTVSGSPYAGFNSGETDLNNNIMVSAIHTFSPTWVSETKAMFNRLNDLEPFGQQAAVPTLYTSGSGTGTILGQSIIFPGYDPFTPGSGIPFGGPQNYAQVYEDLTWNHGKHDFRFGGSFSYLRDNRTFGAYETAGEYLSSGNVGDAIGNLVSGNLYEFQVAINPQGKYPGESVNLPIGAPNFSRSNRYRDPAMYFQDSWKVTPTLTLNLGIRWEYYGVQHNKDAMLDANFYPQNLGYTPTDVENGTLQIAPQSPVGALWKSDWTDFAPRVGFAWNVFGDEKTSLRGGYGIAYDPNFNNVTFNVIQNPPNYETVSVYSSQMPLPISANNYGPFSGTTGSLTLPTPSLRNVDPSIKTQYAHLFSMSLEHQFSHNILVGADYSGSLGERLYDIADYNYYGYGNVYLGIPCSAAASEAWYTGSGPATNLCNATLNSKYGPINVRGDGGSSVYNGLNLRATVNQFHGLTLTTNYTWSHSTDNLSSTFSDTNGTTVAGGDYVLGYLDPYEKNLNWGNSDFDIRQRFVVSAVYQTPGFHGNRLASAVVGGWSIAPIFEAHTGSPYSIYDCSWNYYYCPYAGFTNGIPVNGNSNPAAITSTPNTFNYQSLSGIDHYTNPQFFFSDLPPFPADMSGRNTFRGPGYWNLNMGLYKTFKFTERVSLQLRGEAYNLFNHANLYVEGGAADTLTTSFIPACYGCSGSEYDRRNLQLAAKIIF